MTVIFETDRLTVETLSTDRDEGFILDLLNEPGFLDNIGDRGVRDLEGARNYIESGPATSYRTNGFGLWRVTDRATGAPVGMCGLVKREGLEDPDVGYAFLSTAWGRGYAPEAAAATLAYARDVLGLKRIVAITKPTNVASMRVLEKIGMRREGDINLPSHEDPSTYFIWDA